MPSGRLELPRTRHWYLKPGRLPIPPGGQIRLEWNERESNPSLKSSFWRFFSPSTAEAPHVPVYRIFKVQVECLGSRERNPKPVTRRYETNRSTLNHPLTITRFGARVKGANRLFQAVNRPFVALARKYTAVRALEQQLHQIRRVRAKWDCRQVCVRGEALGSLEVFKRWPLILDPYHGFHDICASFHLCGCDSVVHVSSPWSSIFPNKTPVPLLFSFAPPHLCRTVSTVKANGGHMSVSRTGNHRSSIRYFD